MNTILDDKILTSQNRLVNMDHMVSELQKGLINDIYWLLKESCNYDAIINVGDSPNIKCFKVHTIVLSARSLYFRAIFSNYRSSGKKTVIEVNQVDIKPEVFEVILEFLYTGKISLEENKDMKNLFDYIIAAEKLWLYQLIHYIENYLIHHNSEWLKSNFLYALTIIKSNSSSFRLLHEFVNDMLTNNAYLIFNSGDFNKLPEPILVYLLQNRKFSKDIDEEKIWDVVLNWGINQNEDLIGKDVSCWICTDFSKLQVSLRRCIPLIHFTNISPKTFYEVVYPYKIIFPPRLYEKIMHIPTYVTYNKLMRPSSPILLPTPSERFETFLSVPGSTSPSLNSRPLSPTLSEMLTSIPRPISSSPNQRSLSSAPFDTFLSISRSISSSSNQRSISAPSDTFSSISRSKSSSPNPRPLSPAPSDAFSSISRSVSPSKSRSTSPTQSDEFSLIPRSVSPPSNPRSMSSTPPERIDTFSSVQTSTSPSSNSKSLSSTSFEQIDDIFTSIPDSMLKEFPMPPARVSLPLNELSSDSLTRRSSARSVAIFKLTKKSKKHSSSPAIPSSIQYQSIISSKHLVKITNNEISKSLSAFMVRPTSAVYPIEKSESSTKTMLKRSKKKTKLSRSVPIEIKNPISSEPQTSNNNLLSRKTRKRLNRHTVIISRPRLST